MKESDFISSKIGSDFAKRVEKMAQERRAVFREMISEERMQADLELRRKALVKPLERPVQKNLRKE